MVRYIGFFICITGLSVQFGFNVEVGVLVFDFIFFCGFCVFLWCCSRRICFCDLGFPRKLQSEKGKNDFLEEVFRIEEFIKDPWLLRADANATVQVKVPKVAVIAPPPPPQTTQAPATVSVAEGDGGGDVDEAALAVSAQTKRVALQKKAAAASLVAEDYARRFESGEVAVSILFVFPYRIQFSL